MLPEDHKPIAAFLETLNAAYDTTVPERVPSGLPVPGSAIKP